MYLSFRYLPLLLLLSCCSLVVISCEPANSGPRVEIQLPETAADSALDGRLLVLIATHNEQEPRFLIRDDAETQQVFGIDVNNWEPGGYRVVDALAYGYPVQQIAALPAGEYYIQALLHRYETFHLSTGHTVQLPMDRGEGQQWNLAPGNLYSTPQKITIAPGGSPRIRLTLDQEIPPIPEPEDSKYVKHIKIQSDLLTEFWGRPMYIGAHVLLPEGFDEHPEARYPLAIMHGHFPSDFGGWRTTPPDPDMEPVFSERFGLEGYNILQQEYAYGFYQEWTGPNFPRVIAIEIQHPTPYYDDSYAVNSESQGPYGDALTYELIPYIEKQFRGIGEGWARFVYGGSTGGWEALAVQVKYPEEYNTCYAACPDPIDFRAYCLVNIYEDENAYYIDGDFKRTLRPGHRDSIGQVSAYLRDMNLRELALGTKGRSGQQWDIWEATYSPVGPDGYPQRIWDRETGEINPEVAEYWKQNYDLMHILQRDWETLGPKLAHKINLYCGDMDNYYLNNAVYLAEEYLVQTNNPAFSGEITYGDRAEHCWNGDPTQPNAISRLRYHQMFIPKWSEWVKRNAPKGADLTSWRY